MKSQKINSENLISIKDFIVSKRLLYTPACIYKKKGDDKKSGIAQHEGLKKLTFEQCQDLEKKKVLVVPVYDEKKEKTGEVTTRPLTNPNQYYMCLDNLDNYIIFDADHEESYDTLVELLKENDLYNKKFITESFS